MKNRESGFYFVKFHNNWIISEWDSESKSWFICGNENMFSDQDFDEIGNKIAILNKKHTCLSCKAKTEEIIQLKGENNILTYKINTASGESCGHYGC